MHPWTGTSPPPCVVTAAAAASAPPPHDLRQHVIALQPLLTPRHTFLSSQFNFHLIATFFSIYRFSQFSGKFYSIFNTMALMKVNRKDFYWCKNDCLPWMKFKWIWILNATLRHRACYCKFIFNNFMTSLCKRGKLSCFPLSYLLYLSANKRSLSQSMKTVSMCPSFGGRK